MQRKVLLVDDESGLRRSIALGLSQRGIDTEPCADGISALRKLETLMKNGNPLEAIIIDIQLPDIIGTKLAKIIKFKYPGIPIILITGYADKINPEEIRDLKVQALLEKPLSANDPVEEFERTIPQTSEKEEVAENQQYSKSAYLLINLQENCDFQETYKSLYYHDHVVYCDATKGDYDLIMLIQADPTGQSLQDCYDVIKNIPGVKEIECLEVTRPSLEDNTNNLIQNAEDALSNEANAQGKDRNLGNYVCSYILLEVEREKLDAIYPVLRLSDQVIYCDYSTGIYNLILFVHGSYFTQIDRFIEEKLLPIDGILKIKEFPVINLFEM